MGNELQIFKQFTKRYLGFVCKDPLLSSDTMLDIYIAFGNSIYTKQLPLIAPYFVK